MNNIDKINGYVLECVKSGNMNREMAIQILERINIKAENRCEEIAIIGMACKFPGAQNKSEFWENLKVGLNSVKKCSETRKKDILSFFPEMEEVAEKSQFKSGLLEEVDKFDDSLFKLTPKEAMLMDPYQRMLLETVYETMEDAGYGGTKICNTKTAVYIGRDNSTKPIYASMFEGKDFLAVTGSYPSILAGRISYIFNLRGPSAVIDTACSSGLLAVHTACTALANNDCEMAIAGGINLFINTFPIAGDGSNMDMLESTDGSLRAFDKSAGGTVWGEGIGAVLLKPLKKAIKDRDPIYAVIKGSAINNNGTSNGLTAPSAEAHEEVILKAWEKAKINPETLSYIEAHGTGTILGDPIEIKGLTNAFRKFTNKKQFCGIGSVKSNIGHTMSASGFASLIKVVLALKNNAIPPSINFTQPNPYINFCDSPVYMVNTLQEWKPGDGPRRAAISNFGLSGTNCHLILEDAPVLQDECEVPSRGWNILTFSAKSKNALVLLVNKYKEYLSQNVDINLADVCFTANTGRGHYNHRLAIVFGNGLCLKEKLEELLNSGLEDVLSQGIFYKEHRVVSANREFKESGEITDADKRKMSRLASETMERFMAGRKESETQCQELCGLYVDGAEIEWVNIYLNEKRQRLNLPVYPLERKRYWIEANAGTTQQRTGEALSLKDGQTNEIRIRGRKDGAYTEMEIKVAQFIGSELNITELNIYDSFYDLGVESIHATQIVTKISESLGLKLRFEEIAEFSTIVEIASYIGGKISNSPAQPAEQNVDRQKKLPGIGRPKDDAYYLNKLKDYMEPFIQVFDGDTSVYKKYLPKDFLSSNCYVIGKNGEGVIIDPGAQYEEINRVVESIGLKIKYILLTHGHRDHVFSVREIKEKTGALLMVNELDRELLLCSLNNDFKRSTNEETEDRSIIDGFLKEGDLIEIGGLKLQIIHTPGHTQGGICIKACGSLFTGDIMFKNSIGNPDGDNGSFKEIMGSIVNKIMVFEDETILYTGHGEPTTIGYERKNNPFLKNY